MDKEKIMNQLQQKMSKKYSDFEIVEYLGCLALKAKGEILAHFRDWEADYYFIDCGQEVAEWALSNDIMLEFYRAGRKLLKKPIKKYAIKVIKADSFPANNSGYLNINYRANLVTFDSKTDFEDWRASFTKKEIEELKARDDIAIDWSKVELEEVDDDE